MNKLNLLLIAFGLFIINGCKKSNSEVLEKGTVHYENVNYLLQKAETHSTIAYSINDNGISREYYSHTFYLTSKDNLNQTRIKIITDNQTFATGEYILKNISATTQGGNIKLDADFNTSNEGGLLQQKAQVTFKSKKLNVKFIDPALNTNYSFYLDWNGTISVIP